MTIIQTNRKVFNKFIILLLFLGLIGAIFFIFEYNSLVDFRYQAKNLKAKILEVETANADLKEELYGSIDTNKLQSLARDGNLVLDKEPIYLLSDEPESSDSISSSL